MAEKNLVCLLPARNCAQDLGGWFESVERVADAVVALDDGSTDGTRDILEKHPLVRRLLVNPPRAGYAGWDDAANRARLLAAVPGLAPRWILSLDADERIPADDGAALVAFLQNGADPRHAYLMRVYRMVEDLEHFDPDGYWAGRLFHFEPGQRFPEERLHLVPLPTSIPRDRWRYTTLRVKHLVGMTAEKRQARYEKFRESDPGCRYQSSYEALRQDPRSVERWRPRPPGLPVPVNGPWVDEPETADAPALSVIVISRNDEARIGRVIASVVGQEVDAPFEVIAVTSGTDRTADIVRSAFPSVRVVKLPRPALPGEARNAGLALARGRYVTFPGSHIELLPGSLAARLGAHRRGYAMVTVTTLNGTRTGAGWASYFLDHSTVLPGRPSGPLDGPPTHCSYLRAALEYLGGFDEHMRAGEDTLINNAMFALGYGAWREQEASIIHNTPCTTPWRLARHHFIRGKAFAHVLLADCAPGESVLSRPMLRRYLVLYVPRRWWRTARNIRRWGDRELRRRWRSVAWLALLGVAASWIGLWYELLHLRISRIAARNCTSSGPRRS
jgi:glycosyltransferase involved in cell wall biosynthesis